MNATKEMHTLMLNNIIIEDLDENDIDDIYDLLEEKCDWCEKHNIKAWSKSYLDVNSKDALLDKLKKFHWIGIRSTETNVLLACMLFGFPFEGEEIYQSWSNVRDSYSYIDRKLEENDSSVYFHHLASRESGAGKCLLQYFKSMYLPFNYPHIKFIRSEAIYNDTTFPLIKFYLSNKFYLTTAKIKENGPWEGIVLIENELFDW